MDLTGKTVQQILTIKTNAGKNVEKCDATRRNLGHKAALKSYDEKYLSSNGKRIRWEGLNGKSMGDEVSPDRNGKSLNRIVRN